MSSFLLLFTPLMAQTLAFFFFSGVNVTHKKWNEETKMKKENKENGKERGRKEKRQREHK